MTQSKHKLSISISVGLYQQIKSKANISAYIEALIKDAVFTERRESIVKQVKTELLADGDFIDQLTNKLSNSTNMTHLNSFKGA